MNFIVGILGAGIGSGFMAILLACIQRKWKKEDEQSRIDPAQMDLLSQQLEAVVNAQKVITTERIRYLGSCYIYSKVITLEDKEILHEMHEAYRRLGGNGHLDTVMEEVDKLEVVESYIKAEKG